MRRKVKKVSARKFAEQSMKEGIFSPSEMAKKYNEKFGLVGKTDKQGKSLEITDNAFTMALRRMKISPEKLLLLKHDNRKETMIKDIEEYAEVKRYLAHCDIHNITLKQRNRTLRDLRRLFEWMGKTNPRTWTFETLIECMKENIGQDEDGQWKKKGTVRIVLGAFNRCFQGILPEGFSMNLQSEAGAKKDFWEFEEFNEFTGNLESTKKMSKEGWMCLYTQQVERGCREGTDLKTGILSSRWEQINYESRRCDVVDKGERGHSKRLWTQVPCDMFQWLNSWGALVEYHKQVFGYEPTKLRHGSGRMFPINYHDYLKMFHATRKKCNGRLSDNSDKRRPHVLRMTHAQWCKRIGISLENICGDTTSTPNIGRYGVGWTDPKVLLKYYLTREESEYKEQDEIIQKRLTNLGLVSLTTPVLETLVTR